MLRRRAGDETGPQQREVGRAGVARRQQRREPGDENEDTDDRGAHQGGRVAAQPAHRLAQQPAGQLDLLTGRDLLDLRQAHRGLTGLGPAGR